MIKIEVKSADTTRSTGTTKAGKQFPRKQTAYAFTLDRNGNPNPYPERISLVIWDNEQPYASGIYELAPTSLYVGEYGELKLSPHLVPAKVAVSSTTATKSQN